MTINDRIKSMFYQEKKLNLNNEIKTITKGPYGKKIKEEHHDLWYQDAVDNDYRYIGKKLEIIFTQKGYHSKYPSTFNENFIIYYNKQLVYANGYLKKYKGNQEWLDKFKQIYKNTCIEIKRKEKEEKQKELERQRYIEIDNKIQYLFKNIYPYIYEDDKIKIYDLNSHSTTYNSTYDGDETYTTYSGRIMLANGTLVYDTEKNIHHSGLWEDYVCKISDYLLLKEKEEQEEKNKQYQLKKQRETQEQEKIYKNNHSPIDDSDIFLEYFK